MFLLPCFSESWPVARCCCLSTVFVSHFVTWRIIKFMMLWENDYHYCDETLPFNGQWLWDNIVKFVKWQHPALGCEARFAD